MVFMVFTPLWSPRRVYHLTSSSEIKVKWKEIIDLGKKIVRGPMPLNYVLWYPNGSLKSSRLHHNIEAFLFHTIPAIVLDALLILAGQKPFMMRVRRRVNKGCEVLEYFGAHQWDFANTAVIELRKKMNKIERTYYVIDRDDLDIEKYFTQCVRAARLYILDEPDNTLPMAKRNMKIMYWVDRISKAAIVIFFLWMLLKFVGIL